MDLATAGSYVMRKHDEEPFPVVLSGKYALRRTIGGGSFGRVHEVVDVRDRQRYAAKLSGRVCNDIASDPMMQAEIDLYKILNKKGFPGVPAMHDYGMVNGKAFIVMDLLGPSLGELLKYCGLFKAKTMLMIGMQMLQLVKNVHDMGFVHRDIKPDNFAMGIGDRGNIVYLVDYGLAKRINKIRPYARSTAGNSDANRKISGTPMYLSVAAHESSVTDQAGDLEQLCYTVAHLSNGQLPWTGAGGGRAAIYNLKSRMDVSAIMLLAPDTFHTLLDDMRTASALMRPDYARYQDMLVAEFEAAGFVKDWRYDWFEVCEQLARERKSSRSRSSVFGTGSSLASSQHSGIVAARKAGAIMERSGMADDWTTGSRSTSTRTDIGESYNSTRRCQSPPGRAQRDCDLAASGGGSLRGGV